MIKKSILILTLLLLIIGAAYATDVNNLKVPDKWESLGNGKYHEVGDSPGQGSGQNMMIEKWFDGIKEDYYQNNTAESYSVMSNGGNTFLYIDGLNGDSGCFEVVEIDGEKYFVNFYRVAGHSYDGDLIDVMLEFNKLNNLKPVEV